MRPLLHFNQPFILTSMPEITRVLEEVARGTAGAAELLAARLR